jgi:hypothetical protein
MPNNETSLSMRRGMLRAVLAPFTIASFDRVNLSTGALQIPLPSPNNQALASQPMYLQWMGLVPTQQWPVATSNARRIPLQ